MPLEDMIGRKLKNRWGDDLHTVADPRGGRDTRLYSEEQLILVRSPSGAPGIPRTTLCLAHEDPGYPSTYSSRLHQTQMLTHTIDEYVASLYDCLRESLAIAQDCAIKEAQRQKRLYDRKVGAIKLRPGDHVLVRLDAFRGQKRKLKNRWGDDLHTVVTRVADGYPPM